MLRTFHSSLAPALLWAFVLPVTLVPARGQVVPSADTKLALKAALVLTPEFCASKTSEGSFWTNGKETFRIGKVACEELEPALKRSFSSLTRVVAATSSGDAQIVLLPRVIDVSTTNGVSGVDVTVLFEWTVKDSSGKTVWIETVKGYAKQHYKKFSFTQNYPNSLSLATQDAVKDLGAQSAQKMAASPELNKLAQQIAQP